MLTREPLPVYYARQDVLAADLNQLYAYDDDAWRAHNRAFHGCGVVCGLGVRLGERDNRDWAVVSPGYAISPTGDEIEVTAETWLAIDCARPVDENCAAPSVDPAYIVLRPVAENRPAAPTAAVTADCGCRRSPTECRHFVCYGYELACSPTRPTACPPLFKLSECEAERLIHATLLAGDLGATGLFGCLPAAGETAIALARVDFALEERRVTPSVALDDRAYVPALGFLFQLARLAGIARLKRRATEAPVISFLGDPPMRRLRLNRGIERQDIRVLGRGFTLQTTLGVSPADIDVGGFRVVAGQQGTRRAFVNMRVPLVTAADTYSLRIADRGAVYDTADQAIPVVIEVYDIPVRHIQGIPSGFLRWLSDVGYDTAQQVAAADPQTLALKDRSRLPRDRITVALAAQLIERVRLWLSAGAPDSL